MKEIDPEIYTIGYGNDSLEDFLNRLQKHKIDYVVDVRSSPYSKWKPEFNRENLASVLASHELKYVFMGDTLGGKPEDPSCYTKDMKVDYGSVTEKDFFKRGITRLNDGLNGGHRLALMCSEIAADNCHRSKLIGVQLASDGINVAHIEQDGSLMSQKQIIHRLSKGQSDLFGETFTSRKPMPNKEE